MKMGTLPAVTAVALLLAVSNLTACSSQSNASDLPGASGAQPSSSYHSSYRYDGAGYTGGVNPAYRGMMDSMSAGLGGNQTLGFGSGRLLTFTYQQQFDCVVQPGDDRNYSGKPADIDASQFAMPECQVGYPSTIDPTGHSVGKTDPLYVLLPFFETNPKTPAFSKALGVALKKLFGFVPDAYKPDPGVPVQCPAPKDMPATCTMHPLETDLGPVLAQLKLVPPKTTLYVPLANHDHLLNNQTVNEAQEWWQVIVVLVEKPSAWPNAKGTKGITSLAKLRAAQADKQASIDVPTNFFLYFGSQVGAVNGQHMPGMNMHP